MSNAAKSILVYGVYLLVLCVILIVVPNIPLGIFGIPPTNEVWIRIVGVQLLALGSYFVRAARIEMTEFFRWTVPARMGLVVFSIIFVALGLAPINLLLLAAPDLIFVPWTALALRADESARPVAAR
jgi:hypothetical protein